MKGAYYTKQYRNVFAECGHSQEEIDKKLKDAFHTVFYGPAGEKFYFEAGDDMGYFEDTGNFDARTEGMSYAMMMCVQMNMKEEFDRVWKWARTYMYMEDGYNKGYFAWSCKTTGEKNDYGPAPDGEEFFAMSLFFASHRWGDGEGIFNYSREAKNILSACIHNGEKEPGDPIMEPENYLIRFIPSRKFSDPSYHCAHFYELFGEWANEEDRDFWKKAAKASREYLKKACHPETGLQQNMLIMMVLHMRKSRMSLVDATTGIIVILTVLSQTSVWIMSGLLLMNGMWKTIIKYRSSLWRHIVEKTLRYMRLTEP